MEPFEKEFEELENLRREMHRFVQHLSRLTSLPSQFVSGTWMPAVDVYESDGAFLAVFEVPGMQPDKIRVVIEAGVVTVSGEKRVDLPEDLRPARAHQLEIASGPFQRSIRLPSPVSSDGARARYTNGLLYVTFPKATEAEQPRDVPIEEE